MPTEESPADRIHCVWAAHGANCTGHFVPKLKDESGMKCRCKERTPSRSDFSKQAHACPTQRFFCFVFCKFDRGPQLARCLMPLSSKY